MFYSALFNIGSGSYKKKYVYKEISNIINVIYMLNYLILFCFSIKFIKYSIIIIILIEYETYYLS